MSALGCDRVFFIADVHPLQREPDSPLRHAEILRPFVLELIRMSLNVFPQSIHIDFCRRFVSLRLRLKTPLPAKERVHRHMEALARLGEGELFLLLHGEHAFTVVKGVGHRSPLYHGVDVYQIILVLL